MLPAERRGGKSLANAAVLLAGGRRVAVQAKTLLPTYDVFDEKRYFAPAERRAATQIGGISLGITICEDGWTIGYDSDPTGDLAQLGAALVLNLSASPWHVGKPAERRALFAALARRHGVPIVFCNQVGGNDELVFDGGSFFVDAQGEIRASLPLFESALEIVDTELPSAPVTPREPLAAAQLEAGLVLGIRDYFRKQGLPPGAVIGLSGGVDSAVTAHLAALALGADRVLGVLMPGPFSSDHSVADAHALAPQPRYRDAHRRHPPDLRALPRRLRRALRPARTTARPAEHPVADPRRDADGDLERREPARARDRKQERALDRLLHALRRHRRRPRGAGRRLQARRLRARAPRQRERRAHPAQHDRQAALRRARARPARQDDLPPYAILDAVLEQAIEGGLGAASIEPPPGATRELVAQIVRRLDRNEYKRRQSPLVLRTSPKAFGSGRRLPIVHRYEMS